MHITSDGFPELAQTLSTERKRQGLTRSQTAAVCNVSPSFIRDAERHPERSSLVYVVLLVNGLRIRLAISGL